MDFKMWKRAQRCIAQGALTNSKHPDSHVFGIYPTHVIRSEGARVFTENGNYIDYICSLGANFLGHCNPYILEEIIAASQFGINHSLGTHIEVEAAEVLKEMFYFVDKWKFLKTGTEACMAAIKIARAHTGRKLILSQAYHGWSDEFVSLTPPAKGVHTCTDILPLDEHMGGDWDKVAAVIVEPIISDNSQARIDWLHALRKKCTEKGVMLIFDEVITGFRYKKYSVAQCYSIIPDLIVLGKAMGGGLSLSAVGGKTAVMDGNYFVSSTFAGETLSLVACKRLVNLLMSSHKYSVEKLWEHGGNFMDKFNTLGKDYIQLEGYPTRGVFKGEEIIVALFRQEACKAGFLFHNSWFYNFPLVEFDHHFFSFFKDFMDRLKRGEINLEGQLPKSPFAERARNANQQTTNS